MPTIFVSANDTGVGKTWVTASIALCLVNAGHAVQVVKPAETGIVTGGTGDAEWVRRTLQSRVGLDCKVECRTLERYSKPLAPVQAAEIDGATLDFDRLAARVMNLPHCAWRIIEGAGGVAVPLENSPEPRDWLDFATTIGADFVVLVVEDRLGAINQARLLANYVGRSDLRVGWWLNESKAQDNDVRRVNRDTLGKLDFPLWAIQSAGRLEFETIGELPWN